MPKSKRAQVVHLTKVHKKGREHKAKVIDTIRDSIAQFRYVHVLNIHNASTELLQALRRDLKPGRLVHAKNRLMQVAMGAAPENALENNLWKLSGLITGDCALLATDDNSGTVKAKLDEHVTARFAMAGSEAKETLILEAGADSLAAFPPSMEPTLRALGLPTLLKDGKILMMGDYTVCTAGEALSVNASKILKHLGSRAGLPTQMDEFRAELKGTWDRTSSKISLAASAY